MEADDVRDRVRCSAALRVPDGRTVTSVVNGHEDKLKQPWGHCSRSSRGSRRVPLTNLHARGRRPGWQTDIPIKGCGPGRPSARRVRSPHATLEIKNLHARVAAPAATDILKGVDLTVNAGEVHAIMGLNGRASLSQVLAGREAYEVTEGTVTYDGKDLLELSAEERACEGIFLAFQYPVEIPGVSTDYFLKAAVNAGRKHRGEPEMAAPEFIKLIREKMALLKMDPSVHEAGDQRGVQRRREEAERNLPDGRLQPQAGPDGRDGQRPGHRRPQDRRRRGQQPA